MTDKQLNRITAKIASRFRCFGKGTPNVQGENLLAAFNDKPPVFCTGVDVRKVVEFVLEQVGK